ncbi:MAG: ATP-binding protein [Acidobacteria bacterium]|nr:ATP-binding protein [Acidobacteriota bacterium]
MPDKAGSTWRPSLPTMSRENCTICQGTGWELATDGNVSRARPCSCRALDRLIRMKDRVRIPQRYEHCTLAGYQPLNFSQARALSEIRRLVREYPRVGLDVFLAGGPGVGKTHLAVGALREIIPRLVDDALFVDFIDLGQAPGPGSSGSMVGQSVWERLALAPVLILDNFGMSAPGKDIVALVVWLLNGRWKASRLTLFTGERVRVPLLRSGTTDRSSATQVFLEALPLTFLHGFFAHVQFISIVGGDFRSRAGARAGLF